MSAPGPTPKLVRMEKRPLWKNPWTWIVGAVVLWAATVPVMKLFAPDSSTRAEMGDAFGAINALFSGLALAGMVYAILLQRVELRLQREELKLQRQELAETRGELKRQADAAEQQRRALLMAAAVSATTGIVESGRIIPGGINMYGNDCTPRLKRLAALLFEELGLQDDATPQSPN